MQTYLAPLSTAGVTDSCRAVSQGHIVSLSADALDIACRAAGVSACLVSHSGGIALDGGLAARLQLPAPCPFGRIVRRCHRQSRRALVALARDLDAGCAQERRTDLRVLLPRGGEIWLRVIVPAGKGAERVLAILDVTDEREAIGRLQEREKHWHRIVDYNPQWPWIAEADGSLVETTGRWRDATGLSRGYAKSRSWASLTHPEDAAEAARTTAHAVARGEPFDVTARMLLHGEYRWVRARAYPHRDENDQIVRWYGYTEDIHEARLVEERTRWNAEHDALTGLLNRAHFNSRLEQALGSSLQELQRVAVLLIDLDHFKEVNDLLGHHTGDELLVGYTRQLRLALPPDAVAARLGGDEFAVMLPNILDGQALLDCAERIREIKQTVAGPGGQIAGGQIECRASIGAALYPEHGRNTSELMRHADIALYAAKASGRGRSLVYQPQMQHEVRERTAMVSRARTAALSGDVLAYYQPKVEVDTGALAGFEALLRWRDASGKIQSPGSIGAAFDNPEVADLLGKTMLRQVIADLQAWTRAGLDYGSIAINVASAELRRGGFAPHLIAALAEAGLPDGAIEVEVTEGVFLGRGADEAKRAIDMLHAAGIPLSLDDFGTGFASLSHLRALPVDAIKIDRSFIAHIAEASGDPKNNDRAIVSAIVSLGHNLGMKVIAEGIETPAQAQVLRDFGCKYAQGYYFGMPTPAAGIPHLIRGWGRSDDDALFAPLRIAVA